MIKLKDRTQTIILLDFYGSLLSEKQLKTMKSYYFNDLSLSEIALNDNVSKQAISDLLKRAQGKLEEIEEDLGLVEKSIKAKEDLGALVTYIEKNGKIDTIKTLEFVYAKLLELTEEL